jgi:hypothetical protein
LLGLIWLAESTAGYFFLKKNTVSWLTDLADNLKRTGYIKHLSIFISYEKQPKVKTILHEGSMGHGYPRYKVFLLDG